MYSIFDIYQYQLPEIQTNKLFYNSSRCLQQLNKHLECKYLEPKHEYYLTRKVRGFLRLSASETKIKIIKGFFVYFWCGKK